MLCKNISVHDMKVFVMDLNKELSKEGKEDARISSCFPKTNLKVTVAFLSSLFNLIALDKEH